MEEDAPDQQGFKATGKHRQHQPQGQAAVFSILPWVPNIYLSWRKCILAQMSEMSSLTCCPAERLFSTCQNSESCRLLFCPKSPTTGRGQQFPMTVPQGLHEQVSRGLVPTENFTQLGLFFLFSLQFLSSCKNTVQLVWVSTLHPYLA